MSIDSTTDVLVSGALIVGGGVAAYLGSRWLADRKATSSPAPANLAPTTSETPTPATAVSSPAPSPPRPSSPPSSPTAHPSAPPMPLTSVLYDAAPVSSPADLDSDPGEAPVSSPLQSDGKPAAARPPSGPLPRAFDRLFEMHRGSIPIEYMRTLAMKESAMKPATKGRAAWGLLQITEVVRRDYNEAHKTKHARERLLDPETNIAIGCWLLKIIIASYERHHRDMPNLRTDWSNPRYVELVTFGWNAGWTQSGGVGRVVDKLRRLGARDVDLDLVHAHVRAADASASLLNPAKVRWSKGVAALYQRERSLTAQPVSTPNA